jgi:hypothetical protein
MLQKISEESGSFIHNFNKDIEMTKRVLVAVAGVSLLAMASSVMAKGISWDYVAIAWTLSGELEEEPGSVDLKGYQLAAVKSLGDVMFFSLRSDVNVLGDGPVDIEYAVNQFGVGGRFAVAPNVELWGSLNYEHIGIPFVGVGPGADIGVRWQATDTLGLDVTAKVASNVDFEVTDGPYTGFDVVGIYSATPTTAITLSYSDHTLKLEGKAEFSGVTRLGVRLEF